ncbi:MAG TPA: hypothetical protein VLX09_12920 [Stellaceae bacterium]|nr:hypothetical protein [Stellaceae bacterium]
MTGIYQPFGSLKPLALKGLAKWLEFSLDWILMDVPQSFVCAENSCLTLIVLGCTTIIALINAYRNKSVDFSHSRYAFSVADLSRSLVTPDRLNFG